MSKKNRKVTYHLYALEPTEENINAVHERRFYRITPKYILLYERGQRFTNYNEIGESELTYLSFADKRWLLDCNMVIIAEETEKHKDEIASSMGLMIERLAQALQEERAKESSENVGNNQGGTE